MAGVDEATIMSEMGWRTTSVLRHYTHLSPKHKRDAVTKTEEFLRERLRDSEKA